MLWQISVRYLVTHQRQTIICVAGVTISVMMFLAMFAMMQGFRDKFIIETVESTGHIQVNDEPREALTPILQLAYPGPSRSTSGSEGESGGATSGGSGGSGGGGALVLDRVKPREQVKKIKNAQGLIRKLRQLPGVEAVAPEVTGEAIATYGTKILNVSILGIEPNQQQRVTTIGQKLIEGDFSKLLGTADGVIIGRGVSQLLGANPDDSIFLASSTGGRASARVVGVFQTGVTPVDYSRVYMLLNNAQTLLDKKNIINRLTIRTSDYTLAQTFAAQIESIAGYKTESWQESNENFLKIFAIQDVITYIITGALLLVAAFGVLNILIMAVLERVNDIAILKSMGLSSTDITRIFVYQGLTIGLLGSVLGLVLGRFLIMGLRRVPIKMEGLIKAEGLLMSDHPNQYVIAFVAAVVVVLIAAVYPAYRAARYDPVEVIRGAH